MFTPKHLNKLVLPKFQSPDKGLETALNTLARAIESIEIPDVRLVGGTMEWTGRQMLLTPEKHQASAPAEDLNPWQPIFIPSATPGGCAVKFNIGTVQGIVPTNWSEEFDLGVMTGIYKFVILEITAAGGSVSSCTLTIASTAPITPDGIEEAAPPTSHKIVLGVVGNKVDHMVWKTNINMTGKVVFVTTAPPPAVGGEPFIRWYRWEAT